MLPNTKSLLLLSWALVMASVECGGGGGHHTAYVKVKYPHHTIHKHHTEKIEEVKVVEVPVVKEVKVLAPYKVPYKVHVPYIIKQQIHTIPVHSKPVHTDEHIHHKPTHHHHHGHYDSGKSFSAHAASNVAPMVVSHSPVEHSSHDFPAFADSHQAPQTEAVDSTSRNFFHHSIPTTHLYTNVQNDIGFGSQEGQAVGGFGIKEVDEFGEVQAPAKPAARASVAYPYPFSQAQSDLISGQPAVEYGFGFTPSIYDFVSYH